MELGPRIGHGSVLSYWPAICEDRLECRWCEPLGGVLQHVGARIGLRAPIDFLTKMTKDKVGVVSGAGAFFGF